MNKLNEKIYELESFIRNNMIGNLTNDSGNSNKQNLEEVKQMELWLFTFYELWNLKLKTKT